MVLVRDYQDEVSLAERLEALLSVSAGGCLATNSIGIAVFPRDAADYETLFAKADQALYRAKLEKEKYVFSSDIL